MKAQTQVSWGLKHPDFEILRMIVNDMQTKQMTDRVGLSDSGVRWRIQRIYKLIGVESRVGAAVWAVRHGIE